MYKAPLHCDYQVLYWLLLNIESKKWDYIEQNIIFADKKDYILFLLRWG